MAFIPHFLLAYGGTIMSGSEVWSNSIRFASQEENESGLLIDEASALEHARTNIAALFAKTQSLMANTTAVKWIKFNRIGADGRYESETESNTLWLDGAAEIKGTSSGQVLPPQCTIAVSWTTARQRGPASRGRIFIPQPALGSNYQTGVGAGLLAPVGAANLATAMKDFLVGLGNWPGIDLTDYVPSVVSNVGEGASEPITGVEVGTVIDTQRRRRNALTEVYSRVELDA